VDHALGANLSRALPGEVDNMRLWHAVDRPTCAANAYAPVDPLAVHDELLVEQARLRDDLRAEHHRCTERVIDGEGSAPLNQFARITPVEPALVESAGQGEQFDDELAQAGKTEGTVLERAVGIAQLSA